MIQDCLFLCFPVGFVHSLFQIRPTLHKFIHLKYSYSAVLGELKTGLFNSQSKMMNKECASHILMMMSEMPLTTAFQQHQLCTKAKIKARLSHRGPCTLRTPPSYPLDKYCITTPPPPPTPAPDWSDNPDQHRVTNPL